MITTRWQPNRKGAFPAWPLPAIPTALRRGFGNHCPACGKTRLFAGYLSVEQECANCHAPLGRYRADDAPPYFTIVIVAHIVVPLMLWMQKADDPSTLLLTLIFIPLTLALTLLLLRPVKGATLGAMLALNMLPDNAAGQ